MVTNVLSQILEVFSQVGSWITTAVNNIVPMFYAENSLTFMGVLAIAGLAFSVVFLNSTFQSKEGNSTVKSL